ncbi:uncharacterized protein [Clytia hemisphaerica]|uniref:Uncharacterized protein n=1 Tax=Clytia hemisphaerica TaxID=252671 RepID=A0A7M5WII6_9CNID
MNIFQFLTIASILIGATLCISPSWQRISQDDGKMLSVSWDFNANETLLNARIKHNDGRIVAGMNKTQVLTFDPDFTMVYGTSISMFIKPFNLSLHFGSYNLNIKTTNGVKDFAYNAAFELAKKTIKDVEEVLIEEIESGEGGLETNVILIIVAASVFLCVVVMVILICYKKHYMKEASMENPKKVAPGI